MEKIRITRERYLSLKEMNINKLPSITLEEIPTQYGNGGFGAIINDGAYIVFESEEGKRIFEVIGNIFNSINNELIKQGSK